jgi:hypothetical protein
MYMTEECKKCEEEPMAVVVCLKAQLAHLTTEN